MFGGLQLTQYGIAPSDDLLKSIRDFPVPTDLKGFGLINQVAWVHQVSKEMEPFRELVKKHSKFQRRNELQHRFEKSKTQIIDAVYKGVHNI